MQVRVATFNLNNLFSRYNFKAEISEAKPDVESEIQYSFVDGDIFKIRTFEGRLVKAKDEKATTKIVDRIKRIDASILAVQEVEDIDTLRYFNRENLNSMYNHIVLIEGNDPRLIDVGLLSKLPIGSITSWQQVTHPSAPNDPVFSRDLLEVEILDLTRQNQLLTLFNTHLKSHFIDPKEAQTPEEKAAAREANNQRRTQQAETIARILHARSTPESRFVLLGDMNDPPDSSCLQGFTADPALNLVNALTNPVGVPPSQA